MAPDPVELDVMGSLGGFQTLPSKANNFSYDEEEDMHPPFKKPGASQGGDDDVPF